MSIYDNSELRFIHFLQELVYMFHFKNRYVSFSIINIVSITGLTTVFGPLDLKSSHDNSITLSGNNLITCQDI